MVLKKIGKYLRFYRTAHIERVKMYNLKWRLLFILLTVSAVLAVSDYLGSKYYYVVDIDPLAPFVLSERLFSWFMTGTLFGIIAMGLMYEGEYFLSIRKVVKEIESRFSPPHKTEKKTRRKR